jgi:hypothetical protein
MKVIKLSFVVFFLLLFSTSYGQKSLLSFGLYGTGFLEETKNASKFALGISGSYGRLYIDVSSNFARGKGEYLNFHSSSTRAASKINVGVGNFGYTFYYKNIRIIPTIGFGWARMIYEDPILFDSYYEGESDIKYNLGLVLAFPVSQYVDITIGGGTYEIFKLGFSFNLRQIQ